MDLFLVITGGILLVIGFLGTFIPILPGAPLAWAGLLLGYFSKYCEVSVAALVITAIVAILVSVVDNIFPIIFTKQSGGSKAGTLGATIGLLIGFFVGPLGILLGPFVGAFIFEYIHDSSDAKHALNAAFGAFKGFLAGTGIKMIACVVFIWLFIAGLF